MATCQQCGNETQMYSHGLPLCPACDKANEAEFEPKPMPEVPKPDLDSK